jgi:hypothetical protein
MNLPGLRRQHEDSRQKDGLQLLRHAASASQCAAVSSGGYIPAASGIPSFVSVGLWECHPRWPSDPTSTEATVRFERQCSSHFLNQEA